MGRVVGRERGRLSADPQQDRSGAGSQAGSTPAALRRFVLRFLLLIALYFAVASGDTFERRVLAPYLEWNARAAGALLSALGHAVAVVGNALGSGVCSIRVDRGCDASTPIALFAALILAFPAAWTLRLLGVLIGVGLLVALNALRIASLYWVGAYQRDLFFVVHTDVWQAAFVLAAIALWILWLLWATRLPGPRAPARS